MIFAGAPNACPCHVTGFIHVKAEAERGTALSATAAMPPTSTSRRLIVTASFLQCASCVSGSSLPRQIINTVLNYQANDRWSLQGSVQWIPEKTPVDNMSTLYADPYAVVDLRTEVKISDYILFFGEITNIFDEKYASSTLIVDQARADQAAFLPGDGRGFFVGMKAKY
ncbi:hypothetical protein ACWF50_20220 [Brucella pseudogrignonensis]|jgi:outer membrane receptor for ferric coprogen and ferric-rhodotorulic acid